MIPKEPVIAETPISYRYSYHLARRAVENLPNVYKTFGLHIANASITNLPCMHFFYAYRTCTQYQPAVGYIHYYS